MSGFFSSGGGDYQSPSMEMVADPYKRIRKSTEDWLVGQMGKPGPYYEAGKTVPDMGWGGEKSLEMMKKYFGNTTVPKSVGLAEAEIAKTLQSKYDPSESPYYQAMKAAAERNRTEALKMIDEDAGARGQRFSGARDELRKDAIVENANNMDRLLGEMTLQERQNRLAAVPQALQIASNQVGLPLTAAQGLQTTGEYDRNLEAARQQAIYNHWMQANYNWPMNIGQLGVSMQGPPIYGMGGYTPSTPSPFSQMMGIASPIIGGWLGGIGGK